LARLDMGKNMSCSQQALGKSKTGGETPLRTNLGEKTSLVFFL